VLLLEDDVPEDDASEDDVPEDDASGGSVPEGGASEGWTDDAVDIRGPVPVLVRPSDVLEGFGGLPAVAVTLASSRPNFVASDWQQSSRAQHHCPDVVAVALLHRITHSPPDGFSEETAPS
jgi:hypothetical protein